MFRISDSKDLISNTELLQKYIKDHDAQVTSKYQKYWDAYSCNGEIFDTSINPTKAPYKPDHRITVNYPRYIVDTYNGFARGIAIKAKSDNDDVNTYIQDLWDSNDLDDINAELHRSKCIFGESYQIIYVNEDGDIETIATDPLESFPIYDNAIKPNLRYFIRTYYDEDNKRHGTISDNVNVYYFDYEGGFKFIENHPHGFDGVPVVVYTMNKARIGLIEPIYTMANAFDKAISEKTNDVDTFSDAYIKILGATLDEKQIQTLRDKRIINIGGKDGANTVVEFMGRPSGDTTQENLLERLERLIFTIAMVCNVSDNNFATSSGIALKMKMQPMSNLAAGDWRLDQASLKRFFRLVCSNPVSPVSPEDWKLISFSHTLNYPDDVDDAASVVTKLDGVISRRTQLEYLPATVVPDVDTELERINTEAEEAAAKAQEMMAATQATTEGEDSNDEAGAGEQTS